MTNMNPQESDVLREADALDKKSDSLVVGMRPMTVDPRLVVAAECQYGRITVEVSHRGPFVDLDFLGDVIAQLVGVRAVLTGDLYPTDDVTRRGLRRMLEAYREFAVESLSLWQRAGQRAVECADADAVAEATIRLQHREDHYEAEIALIDTELDRLTVSTPCDPTDVQEAS